MSSNRTEFDLTDRATFSHWTTITLRYCDQDPMGHVNNCAITAFIEASRTSFIYGLVEQADMKGLEFVLASITIDFRRELLHPGEVDVGVRVIRVGNKSFATGYGIFFKGECVVTARCVSVFFDMETRVGIAPPQSVRDFLRAEMARS
ncbi:MAG: thioesterase family protein [Hyphomicrobiaceae bacterium]